MQLGFNSSHIADDKLPQNGMRKPSAQILEGPEYGGGSGLQSPEPYVNAHYPPYFSRPQNGDLNAAEDAPESHFGSLSPFEDLPVEDVELKPDDVRNESPSLRPSDSQDIDHGEPEWNFELPVILPSTSILGPSPTGEYKNFNL